MGGRLSRLGAAHCAHLAALGSAEGDPTGTHHSRADVRHVRVRSGQGERLAALAEPHRPIGVMPSGSLLPYVWPAILDDTATPQQSLIRGNFAEIMLGPFLGRWQQTVRHTALDRSEWLRGHRDRLARTHGLPPLIAGDPDEPGDIDQELIRLAQASGRPLLPMACSAKTAWRFPHSPHRHLMPAPGAQILVHIGPAVAVRGRSASAIASELRERLDRLQRAAHRDAGLAES